jgi:hypothetical protein
VGVDRIEGNAHYRLQERFSPPRLPR